MTFVFSLPFSIFAGDNFWKPISSAELALKDPKIEKDADAEALFWEVYVADEDTGRAYQTVLQHYLRIKVFNERGREQFSKFDIPFLKTSGVGLNIKIKDIAARTTKADGSTIELKPEDVFEREIVKGEGVRIKAKSFAVPGIEPGAIIEYRWKEVRDTVSFYQRLEFAREIPVHELKYYIKPVPDPRYGMRGQVFNGKNTPFVKEKNNFYSTTMSNIPSFKEEPRMPGEYVVRPWMLLYYTADLSKKSDPAKFWKDHGKSVYETHKALIKASDEVRQATVEAIGDAATPEQKVERIFRFVRAKVKNIYDDSLNLSNDDLKRIKDNKNPADTLKRGQGDGHDINMLFVAMVNTAGLEARVVNLPRRVDNFDVNFTDDYFMRTENVAVKIGDKWQFLDPASKYVPYGMLVWSEEGQPALVSDSKEPIWINTPVSAPENRSANELANSSFLKTERSKAMCEWSLPDISPLTIKSTTTKIRSSNAKIRSKI